MFSGLTNQVSSWMGAAKGGEPQEEKNIAPVDDIDQISNTEKKDVRYEIIILK